MLGSRIDDIFDLERGGIPLAQARLRDLAILSGLGPPEKEVAELLALGTPPSKLDKVEHKAFLRFSRLMEIVCHREHDTRTMKEVRGQPCRIKSSCQSSKSPAS